MSVSLSVMNRSTTLQTATSSISSSYDGISTYGHSIKCVHTHIGALAEEGPDRDLGDGPGTVRGLAVLLDEGLQQPTTA